MPNGRKPHRPTRGPERIAIDLHLHLPPDLLGSVTTGISQILTQLTALDAQGKKLLMASAEIKAAMARIDKATTDIATRITALIARIGTGMSDAEVTEIQSGLEAEATKLEGMATDPDNPTPVPTL